jgi:hypothetical protein
MGVDALTDDFSETALGFVVLSCHGGCGSDRMHDAPTSVFGVVVDQDYITLTTTCTHIEGRDPCPMEKIEIFTFLQTI